MLVLLGPLEIEARGPRKEGRTVRSQGARRVGGCGTSPPVSAGNVSRVAAGPGSKGAYFGGGDYMLSTYSLIEHGDGCKLAVQHQLRSTVPFGTDGLTRRATFVGRQPPASPPPP